MTREDFYEQVVKRRMDLTKAVLDSKSCEYSTQQSAFQNFEFSTGISFHSTSPAVAWEFMVKHLTSIKDIIGDYEKSQSLPSVEKLEEKIGDAVNYLILIEGMLKEAISQQGDVVKVKYHLI